MPAPSRSSSRNSLQVLLSPRYRVVWDLAFLRRGFHSGLGARGADLLGRILVSDFCSGVVSNRALCVRGEPIVSFVLVTGIWVEASCGRAEECPRCGGQGAPTALGSSRWFLIPKVGRLGVFVVLLMLVSLPVKWVFFSVCVRRSPPTPLSLLPLVLRRALFMDIPSRRR